MEINLLLETHIFNFDEEIYGNELTVQFLTFIRPEQKFDNFEKLTSKLKKILNEQKNITKFNGI